MSKVSTQEIVKAVILANEKRYRQNNRANFHTEYAVQFILETIHGQEGLKDVNLSPDDIINILTISDNVWSHQTRDRTRRIQIVASAWGVLHSAKAPLANQYKVLQEYDLDMPDAMLDRINGAISIKMEELAGMLGIDEDRINVLITGPKPVIDDDDESDEDDEFEDYCDEDDDEDDEKAADYDLPF